MATTGGDGHGKNNVVLNVAKTGGIDCSSSSFWSSWGSVDDNCYYFSYPAEFYNPAGYWKLVESCSGAETCQFSVSYGVTSTTTDSTSATWTNTLTESTQEGMEFMKETLTTSVSTSVTSSQSEAYSQSVTKACTATCPGDTHVWQWMMDTNEVAFGSSQSEMTAPFTTYSCNYICSNTTQVPLCPPNYCVANTNCQKCTQNVFA